MSHHYLEASARSIGFSKAIRFEQAQRIEDAVQLPTTTSYDDTSDTISEAILWELERHFNTGATCEVVSNDKCERFALTLSEDEMTDDDKPMILLPAATNVIEEQESITKSRTPKRAQRSLHHKKRPYTWRQPLKNKGGLIRKRLLEATLTNTKSKASMELITNTPKKINTLSEYSTDVLGDDFNMDELFQETDEESLDHDFNADEHFEEADGEEIIMMHGDTSSEDASGMAEDEDDLLLPKSKNVRATPPSTTRKLVSLIRKKMIEFYDLVVIKSGDVESVSGLELAERIKGAVDKVKLDKVGDLSATDIVTLHEALSLLEENQLAMAF